MIFLWLRALPRWIPITIGSLAAVGVLFLLHGHWERRAYNTAYNDGYRAMAANVVAAQAKAAEINHATVRATEAAGDKITKDAQDDLEKQLADARALAADYARRMRATSPANSGGTGKGRVSEIADSPGKPDNSGGVSVVRDDDLRICVENTVKAKGWQQWYQQVRDRYNAATTP